MRDACQKNSRGTAVTRDTPAEETDGREKIRAVPGLVERVSIG